MLTLLFLVLCLTGLIASAPANVPGRGSSAAPGTLFANTTSSFILHPHQSASNSAPAICHVGNTHTVLVIRFQDDHSINPVAMKDTIDAATVYVDRAIRVRGDGWLPASNDPFFFDVNVGIAVGAGSTANAHLTWQVLRDTLQGFKYCVVANEWYDEAHFQVYNGEHGHVADGMLKNSKKRLIASD